MNAEQTSRMILSTSCVLWGNSFFTKTLRDKYYYCLQFTYEKSEAQQVHVHVTSTVTHSEGKPSYKPGHWSHDPVLLLVGCTFSHTSFCAAQNVGSLGRLVMPPAVLHQHNIISLSLSLEMIHPLFLLWFNKQLDHSTFTSYIFGHHLTSLSLPWTYLYHISLYCFSF